MFTESHLTPNFPHEDLEAQTSGSEAEAKVQARWRVVPASQPLGHTVESGLKGSAQLN